jgi:hypothetical protein
MSTGRESATGSEDSDRETIVSIAAEDIVDQFHRDVEPFLTEAAATTVMPTPLTRRSLEEIDLRMTRETERLSSRVNEDQQAANVASDRRILDILRNNSREGRIDFARGFPNLS